MKARFFLTDMPVWLVTVLVLLMLPRTLLNELGVVTEGTLPYYVLALTPFAIWLAVAVVRKNQKPMADFLMLGLLFGLLLAVVHQLLWNSGSAVTQHAPQIAIDIAANFDPGARELVTRLVSVGISLVIGLGSGLVIGAIALVASFVRSKKKAPVG
jgi:hypothetical protein